MAAVIIRLPNDILSEIDQELRDIAQTSVTEASRVGRSELRLPSGLDNYEAASTFLVQTNSFGRIRTTSPNVPNRIDLLDQQGFEIVAESGEPTVREVGTLRVLTVPLTVQDGSNEQVTGYLQVGRYNEIYDAYQKLNQIALLIAGATLTATLFMLVLLMPVFLRPLEKISQVAEQVTSADDLSIRIDDVNREDELGRLTRAINQLLHRIEDLFRAQQRLLADVSHELRTPLTAIRGNLDLLRLMGSADRESLDAIQSEVDRMTRLVEDILTLARAEAGGLPIRQELVELDTTFLDVYRQVMMLKRPCDLQISDLDQVAVLGDPDRLKQVMLILVDNATKYTPAGGDVRMGLSKTDTDAIFVVEDSGIGIAAEELPYIFDRFYRVDKARARESGGSGLGLSIANQIMLAHGGDIQVTSEQGVGTTFTVTLPLFSGQPWPINAPSSAALPAKSRTK